MRNAPLNTTGANLPKLFLVPRQKGGKGGQGWEKLAKAQHQVNKWLHSHQLFTPFRCHKKATVAQKAQHQVRPIGRCSALTVFWGRPRSKVVSPPPPCLWLCGSIGRRSSGGSDALTTPEAWSASSASTRGASCKFYYIQVSF